MNSFETQWRACRYIWMDWQIRAHWLHNSQLLFYELQLCLFADDDE